MNREFKFRVWEKSSKQFLKKQNCTMEGDFPYVSASNELIGYSLEDLFNNNNFIVQQFTGLQDKNKRDIYEGDIIKIDPDLLESMYIYDSNYSVAFDFGAFGLQIKDKVGNKEFTFLSSLEKNKIKIIGNIFKNLNY